MAKPKDENKIEKIYQAALNLVVKEGFVSLKMSEVAKAAGLATGTLYIYFKSKEELINQLYLHLKSKKSKKIIAGYQKDAPFLKSFRQLWFNFFQACLVSEEESAFLEQYYRSPYLTGSSKQKRDKMLEPIHELLRRGQAEGYVKSMHTEIIIAQMVGPIHELVRLHYESQLIMDDQIMEQAFKMAWDSIKR